MPADRTVFEAAGGYPAILALARAWQDCFALALDDAGLPVDERLRTTLKDWFRAATEGMSAYPRSPDDVPSGLALAVWSWDGPPRSA